MYKQGQKIIYEEGDYIGPNKILFIKEVDPKVRGGKTPGTRPRIQRRMVVLCPTCKNKQVEVDLQKLNNGQWKECKSCAIRRSKEKQFPSFKTGDRIDKLVVLEYLGRNEDGQRYYKTQCECGNIRIITHRNLTNNKTKKACEQCSHQAMGGNFEDITGQRFGRLIVLEQAGHRGPRILWKCQCDCGNIHITTGALLRRGECKSCGCLHKEQSGINGANAVFKDLTGQVFDKLTVIRQLTKEEYFNEWNGVIDHRNYWLCQCECGNQIARTTQQLTGGHRTNKNRVLSCGCYYQTDLLNQQIGYWKVLKDLGTNFPDKNHRWLCKCCNCGQEKEVLQRSLVTRTSLSCGCTSISKGEYILKEILEDLNIFFETQYKFFDCKDKQRLPFDFYLSDYNCCIEYDGKQHFENIPYWGGEQGFKERQKKDNIKNQYCKDNNIYLIRIPYTDYNILNEEYIMERLNNLDKYDYNK